MSLAEFSINIEAVPDTGAVDVRVMPFGEASERYDWMTGKTRMIQFDAGSLEMPENVPMTLDHGPAVLDRIGITSRSMSSTDGLYASLVFADTDKATDTRELLRIGAVTEVSAGIMLNDEKEFTDDNGVVHLFGTVDHVAIVPRSQFGKAGAGSKVLQVHSKQEGAEMPEATETVTTDVVTYDDTDMRAEIVRLSDIIDTMENRVVTEPDLFESVGDFVKTETLAAHGNDDATRIMEKFALSSETTTTAAGVVPDYLSSEILTILATSRAFLGNIPSDPIGDDGMTVVYPEVTAKGTVAKQATENTEVGSGPVTIGVNSTDLFTYSGANKVSQQLIMRSQPGYVSALLDELGGQYMQVTEKDSLATSVAGAGGTAVLADLGADAAATFAAFNVASSAVILGVRRPADTVWLASDRWTQINSLVDATGRPMLVFPENGATNAQGQSGFDVTVAQYHGWVIRLAVDAPAGTCLIGASQKSVANLELSPAQLSALQVSTISTDIGIWGLQNVAIKFPDGLYTLTVA